MPTSVKLAQDKQRRVWVILSLRYNALSEWNGTRWIHHAVPRHYKLTDIAELAFDRLGRVWLLPYSSHGQTAIYDPRPQSAAKGAAWQVFPNYRAALLAELKVTPQNPPYPQFLPELDNEHDPRPWQTPDVRGRRLCYLQSDDSVHYYDGGRWQRWTIKAITGLKSNYIDLEGPVYFGQGGVLTLPVGGKVWRYESKGGQSRWKEHAFSAEEQDLRHARLRVEEETVKETVPDHELPVEDGSTPSVYTDRNGEGWYLWKRQLYKAVPGLKAAQFAPGANHPFLDERPLNTVLVDKFGTVFCDTGEEIVILLPTAPTVVRAKAYAKSIDAFVIDCATQPQGPQGEQRFRWRLNSGPWSTWRTASRFHLSDLPGGTHRLEVMSLDARLRSSPKPAVVTLKVHLDADKQVADFIADLSSPDYAKREKAVVGLAKQPQRALTPLRAARQKANADLKWWIDAAIQAAEAQK